MAEARVTLEVGNDVITISNPPLNALAVSIIMGLKEKLAEAMSRDDVKAVVLTGNGSGSISSLAGRIIPAKRDLISRWGPTHNSKRELAGASPAKALRRENKYHV